MRGDEVMAAKRTTAQGGFAQRNAAPDFARQTQKVGPMTARAVSPQAKRRRKPTSAGVRARGQPWNKGTYPGRPRGNMRGHIRAKRKWGSEHVAPSGGNDRPARFRRRRNATGREQGPGRERKPRVGKEEGPRFRGADYESPTAYFLSIKKVGKER